MIQLIYVSSACKLMNNDELTSLLRESRFANKIHGITGLLLYKDGNFIQVIEGAEKEIDQLYINIKNDLRHKGVLLLLREPIAKREFPAWHMGFKEISETELGAHTAINSQNEWESFIKNPSKAKTLLNTFREVS